jgi:hypothetical protein
MVITFDEKSHIKWPHTQQQREQVVKIFAAVVTRAT